MAILTPEQDRLLTDDGFIERFEQYWLFGKVTQIKAWQKANEDVRAIRGRGRYEEGEFERFIGWYKHRRARARKTKVKLNNANRVR